MKIRALSEEQVNMALIICAVAGFWLMFSPLLLNYGEIGTTQEFQPYWNLRPLSVATMNDFFVGFAILMFSLLRALTIFRATSLNWVVSLAGLWVCLSPWLLIYSSTGLPAWNNFLTGFVIFAIAGWTAVAPTLPPRHATTTASLRVRRL
jgi:hypothetical protein